MNYKRIIITVTLLLICSHAHAGYFIFHSGETITGKRASCGKVCSDNPNALRVNESTYLSTNGSIHKVVDKVIVNKTQAEIDAEALAKDNAKKDARRKAIEDFNLTGKEVFLIFIKIRNSKVSAGVKITKQDIIDQMLLDEGL